MSLYECSNCNHLNFWNMGSNPPETLDFICGGCYIKTNQQYRTDPNLKLKCKCPECSVKKEVTKDTKDTALYKCPDCHFDDLCHGEVCEIEAASEDQG